MHSMTDVYKRQDFELFIRFFERTAVFKHHHAADLCALAKV